MSTGRCFNCATSFGVFNKQLGCKNCGFAFCKKCLVKKTSVPKLGGEKAVVCNKCFDVLSGKAQPVHIEPPQALTKRLQAASQEPKEPQNIAVKSKASGKGLTTEDAALSQRLANLKQDQKPSVPVPSVAEIESRVSKLKEERQLNVPSEHEIAERLAVVRGQDPNRAMQPAVLKLETKKTQAEQVDDLLDEICQEVEIDSHATKYVGSGTESNDLSKNDTALKVPKCDTYNIAGNRSEKTPAENANWSEVNQLMKEVAEEMEVDAQNAMKDLKKDKELWDRVQRLKAERKASSDDQQNGKSQESDSSDENEEEITKKVLKQIMEESRLEEVDSEIGFSSKDQKQSKSTDKPRKVPCESPHSDRDSDELPWCCICTNDAVLRCRGCDGDLYCQRCFKEGHSREDLGYHKTLPYKKP